MTDQPRSAWKNFSEEIEVSGHQLLEEVHRLIKEGNVRRLQVISADGDVYLTVPLTAGAIAGGLVAVSAPWLAMLAALAGLVARVKISIARDGTAPSEASAGDAVPPPPAEGGTTPGNPA